MELWLRYRKAKALEADEKVHVTSQADWHELIYNPDLISSVLWPDSDLFGLEIKYKNRNHPHEAQYQFRTNINEAYRNACRNIAGQLDKAFAGARCLVYAPLRGALPIWRGIFQYIQHIETVVYYPVTSSFIAFPAEFGIFGKKNKPASGRFNNRFELQRLKPFLADFDFLFYVDEIISGGMMKGHLKEMFALNINRQIPIVAVGLADAHGKRSQSSRKIFEGHVNAGRLNAFIWDGCSSVITEDQKFLLGVHYVDYQLGPHAVPLLDENLSFYNEKIEFDNDVFTIGAERGIMLDPFCAIPDTSDKI
jgi:hypothetical protein